MEQVNFEYSQKNIPNASFNGYLKCLLEKTEHFLKRMRWKALYFLNPSDKEEAKENFGFKTRKSPPVIEELKHFEQQMLKMVKDVEFENKPNKFQKQMKKDISSFKKSEDLLIKADKTTNFYKMEKSEYTQLLNNNVTKSYKKSESNYTKSINNEAKEISQKLELDDRIEVIAEKEAFITLKDHKPNFNNKPTCRLINPTKSELGCISKVILDRIIKKIVSISTINLWKNTKSVLEWFKAFDNKEKASFISFDIVDFYPSISENLLKKAMDYASQFEDITDEERSIIMHTKKTVLFNNNVPWQKRQSTGSFDITMGSYDGAETCELVVCYLLSILSKKYGKSVGLYRDDGLGIFYETPQKIEKIKKEICQIFKDNELKITIEANKKVVNFLDVTLDLNNGQHKPYMKPGNTILYVHAKSNHPPNVLKNIPIGINKRLSEISSDENCFNETCKPYQDALDKSEYKFKLSYNNGEKCKSKRNRQRNIIWYNPPFENQVQSSIGKCFLRIVDNSFKDNHPLHKIFNRNTLKISYSCMPSIGKIINSHNKRNLKKDTDGTNIDNPEDNTLTKNRNPKTEVMCNCRKKTECPLNGECKKKEIVYQATVKTEEKSESYVGLTATTFKCRYNNHMASFRNESNKYCTELSKYIWSLKESNTNFVISWRILRHAKAYSNVTKKCDLCLTEKYFIICKKGMATLNNRNELVSKCRHSDKYLLKNN